jgi:predicted nucleotidyltransferase
MRIAMDRLPPNVRDVLIELKRGLEELYGDRFRGLLLYGSYARGTANEESDVDLLLLLKGPVDPAREIVRAQDIKAPLSLEAEIVLSLMPVDIKDFERAETMFLRNVRKDAIAVAA